MRAYKALNQQIFTSGEYKLVPIRHEDRYDIMQWRNEQMYHLRQSEPLTKEKQDWYFHQVVTQLFDQDRPSQILFSFLKDGVCIGYGGLVHINWVDKNAEISFIMNTSLEPNAFHENWVAYLLLIEQIAFKELSLHKIYTYAFDLRPKLYQALSSSGFIEDARLNEHCLFEGKYIDVLIHSKINCGLYFRLAELRDLATTFKWATDKQVRAYSLNQNEIKIEEHEAWFKNKIVDGNCLYYIVEFKSQEIGSLRLDIDNAGTALISYLLDPNFHGRGFGKKILEFGILRARVTGRIKKLVGIVMKDNAPSIHLFYKLGFISKTVTEAHLLQFEMLINENS